MSALGSQHLDGCDDEKCTKEIENPMKPADQLSANTNHRSAHRECANNSPEKQAMLIDRRNGERRENHRNDKEIVNAQGLLDDVSSQILASSGASIVDRVVNRINCCAEVEPMVFVGEIDWNRKGKADRDPDDGPFECLLHRHNMRCTVKDPKIQRQEQENQRNKSSPKQHHVWACNPCECARLRFIENWSLSTL